LTTFRTFSHFKFLMRHCTVYLFICFWLSTAAAQTPAYLHYTVRDGLPANLVHIGLQDRQGLLWFGTEKGLATFDGTRFRSFGMAEGLPDPEVLNLKEDRRGRVWISCFRKKLAYRYHGRIFTDQNDALFDSLHITSGVATFFEDLDSSTWVAGQSRNVNVLTQKGARSFSPKHLVAEFSRIEGKLFAFGTGNIMTVSEDFKTTAVYTFKNGLGSAISPYAGVAVAGNRVLYAFADRLILLEWKSGQFHEVCSHKAKVGRVFSDRQGRFWACSLNDGAFCYGYQNSDLSNPTHYLRGKKTTCVFDDSQGTLWFCTAGDGIYALPLNTPMIYDHRSTRLSSEHFTALGRSHDGKLLSGDDEGNFQIWTGDSAQNIALGSLDGYNRCRQIVTTEDNAHWVVTDEKLYRIKDGQSRQAPHRYGPKVVLVQPKLSWVGTFRSLGYYPDNSLDYVDISHSRRTTALGDDDSGNVWAGGIEGIYSQRDTFQKNWGDSFLLLKSRIVNIQNAGSGNLWIVTPESGLLRATTRDGQILSVERHAPTIKNIQSLYAEPSGNLWLSTNRGVYGLNRNRQVIHFDHFDGLADDDVNAALFYGDTLWTATAAGLTRLLLRAPNTDSLFPTYIVELRYQQQSHITIRQLLDTLPDKRTILLPSDASLLELSLAGLDYRSRGNLRYECVLTRSLPPWYWCTFDNLIDWAVEGFEAWSDTTWADGGHLKFGVALPAGKYTLQTTALTPGDVRSQKPDICTWIMCPAWYSVVWFWIIFWGTVVFSVFRLLRARAAFYQLRASASQLQLQALQSQINPHFVGNSINAIQQFFYPPNPMKASAYIAIFTGLLRRTLLFSESTFIPFSEELAYDRDYLKMIELRFGEKFKFDIIGADDIPPAMPFPTMLLQPILENATMHGLSPKSVSKLDLLFFVENQHFVCVVKDNGIGWRAAQERKKETHPMHLSKGIELLRRKIDTLNSLYNIGLTMEMDDLSDRQPSAHGTSVTLRFKVPVQTAKIT